MDKSNNKYYVNTFGQLCYSNGVPVSNSNQVTNKVNSNYMFEPSAPPISSMNLEHHALNDVFYYNNINQQIMTSYSTEYQMDEKYLPSAPPEDLVILNNQQKINNGSNKNVNNINKSDNENKNQKKEKCIVS